MFINKTFNVIFDCFYWTLLDEDLWTQFCVIPIGVCIESIDNAFTARLKTQDISRQKNNFCSQLTAHSNTHTCINA